MRRPGRTLTAAAALALTLLVGCSPRSAGPDPTPAPSGPVTRSPAPTPEPLPSPATPTPEPEPTPAPEPPAPPATPAPSPAELPTGLLGTDWERLPTADRVVALTFDGGSSDTAVTSILATLAGRDVDATFFLTGDFARRFPAQVSRIVAAGHSLGNHSDNHEHYPALTNAEIAADLAAAEAAITAAGDATARPLFRFPFGDRTSADVRAVNLAGYVPVRWTVDSLGGKGTSGGLTATAVADRVVAAATPGEIVLMHVGANPDDGTTLDADALPAVIDRLRAAGYSFVTLDRLLS